MRRQKSEGPIDSRVFLLWGRSRACRVQVLAKLRDDEHETELVRLAASEVARGLLEGPFAVDGIDMSQVAIAARFSVEQGKQKSLPFLVVPLGSGAFVTRLWFLCEAEGRTAASRCGQLIT